MKLIRQIRASLKERAQIPKGLPPRLRSTWLDVRRRRLTYLSPSKMASLIALCRDAELRNQRGLIVEAGCALGGSAILLCAAKTRARPLEVYDVFDMIPPPGNKDGADVHERYEAIRRGKSKGIGGDEYYGYRPNLYDVVEQNFAALGFPVQNNAVRLIRGLVQDTLVGTEPVVLAHIDVDWYDPVMTCLERLVPRLSARGAIVFDDYKDWSGCRRAVDEYFAGQRRVAFSFDDSPGHLIVRRLGAMP